MGLDLNSREPRKIADLEEEGTEIELCDAAGNLLIDPDTGATVKALVAGTYSNRYQTAITRAHDKAQRAAGRATGESIQQDQRILDAVLVIKWDLTEKGQMADPVKIFKDHPYIREQIVRTGGDHARFFASA